MDSQLGPLEEAEPDLGGRGLEAGERARLERAFGASLEGVRLHDDTESSRRANQQHAAAVTLGQHVFLGAAAQQESPLFREALLAHEVAHTLQQRGAGPAIGEEVSEYEADTAAMTAIARDRGAEAAPAAGGLGQGGLALRRCDDKSARIAELKKKQASLGVITGSPMVSPLGPLAGAMAEDTLVTHQLKQLETGRGTLTGNKSGELPSPGVTPSDCTILVLDILARAFRAQGKGADWKRVETEFYRRAGGKNLSGLDVQQALVSELGWKGIFWAPNPRFAYPTPEDKAEHAAAYKEVRDKGTYKGLPVGPTVIDYRPAKGSATKKSTEGIDRLKKVPFGVLSARGATHMALIVRGVVIEVHWDVTSDKPHVIQGTPLENWGWLSGAIVAPATDVDAAFPPAGP